MSALYHAYTQTIADGTATSVVRPSDWNSAHIQGQTLSGNTAGVSSFTGTNFVLQGGNNVTLSAATAAGAATIIISGANTVAQTVQTQASGAIAGTGFTSTTTAGTAITAAMGTNGLSMAVPAFLTTYAAQTADTNKAGTGFTSTTTTGTAISATLGTGGLSMAVPVFLTTYVAQTTQTQPAGNIVGAGYTSTTQAGSTVGITQNSNGLSAAWPPFITTATQSTQTQASGAIAGTGFTSTTTTGTAVTAALGTNGLSMAVPAFITTFVNDQTSGRAGTGFTSTTTAGTAITAALGTNGLSMAVPNFLTTSSQSVQTQASGAIAGTGFTSTTTAGTAITAALGTNGLSMAVPAYLTTYVAQTTQTQPAGNIAGVGTTLALTNLTGTMNVGTNGVALSLSAGAGGPGGGGVAVAAGASTVSNNTVLFSNANGVSFGLNGSTMTASIIANNTYDGWAPYADLMMVAGQQGQGTLYIEPEHSPYYFQDRVGVPIAYTNATNSTGSVTLSYWMGFYTQNASTLSLASSTSFSTGFTFSGTVASYSLYSGMRLLTFPWALTVQEQEIWVAHLSRTTTAGANASISQMLVSNVNSNFVGFFGQAHTTTQQFTIGQGVYTVTTSGMPNSIAFSQIQGSGANNFRAPAVMFINSTV